MIGIDTNVLVRFLVGDDINQADKVYSLFKKAEAEKGVFFVSLLVVLELIWVLESAYEFDRVDILDSISQLTLMPILKFEKLASIQHFILEAQASTFDLSDLLIAHSASTSGCDVTLTFDKKASKYQYFELIR